MDDEFFRKLLEALPEHPPTYSIRPLESLPLREEFRLVPPPIVTEPVSEEDMKRLFGLISKEPGDVP